MKSRWVATVGVLLLAGLVGCSAKTPSLSGSLSPWSSSTPISGRKLVLCQTLEAEPVGPPVDCQLLDNVAVSDTDGNYEFFGVPDGTYFLLYDSGLGDFDATVNEWAGKTLQIGDGAWLADFLDVSPGAFLRINTPEGFGIGMGHDEWNMEYVKLTLQFGSSPFVLAHDVAMAKDERVVMSPVIEVMEGEAAQTDITVVYHGE